MHRRDTRRLVVLTLAIILAAFRPELVGAQEIEDLTAEIEAVDLPLEFEALWENVSAKCSSLEQIESIPLFTDFITRLEAARAERELATETESWLLGALFCRAEASFNMREMEVVDADLRRILELDPGFEIDAARSSPRLAALLQELRDETIGELLIDLQVEPVNVTLDGREVSPLPGTAMPILAGPHRLDVTRPGFSAFSEEIEIVAGETLSIDVAIERTSAVVQASVEPCGALLELDGQPVGEATGSEAEPWVPDAACSFVIDGLDTGEHVLAIRSEGYRTWEGKLEIAALTDYILEPIALEATRGWLVLQNLPPGIQYTIDGRLQQSPSSSLEPVRFELPTGSHEVRIDLGTVALFEQQIQLEDKEEEVVEIELTPTLSYLGSIGGDGQSRSQLDQWIESTMIELDSPLYRRAGCDVEELLREHTISVDTLRAMANARPIPDAPWNERRLQQDLDARCRGSLYVLGVLPDDALPVAADLWIWASDPGPISSAVRTITLPPGETLEAMAAGMSSRIRFRGSWLGVQLIDSMLAEGPVVLSVVPDGPAAAAGIVAGDVVTTIGGDVALDSRAVQGSLAALPAGSDVALRLLRGSEAVDVVLETVASPIVDPVPGPEALPAAASAQVAVARQTSRGEIDSWVLDLNHAAVLMGAGEWGLAARALDGLRAPRRAGLSSGTVDYLLARALLNGGNEAHRERARTALASAANDAEARLGSDDGPRVAPRARIRLHELTAAGPAQ